MHYLGRISLMEGVFMTDFKRITSKDNTLIKQISLLQTSARERKKTGTFVAEGLRLLLDCYENDVRFLSLVIADEFLNKHAEDVENLAKNSKEIVVVTDTVFTKISDTKSPQGILAVIEMPENNLSQIKSNGKYVALENVADPSNLGAVSRTAEALGVDGIILSSGGCDPYSPKALRSSMGTLLRMPVIVLDNFTDALKNSGLNLYACVVSGGKSINEVEFPNGSVVIIGNEANGLTDAVIEISQKITIPMSGRAESLNAAVAASIAMWELIKR